MKQKILLLYANQYSLKNEEGRLMEGVTCNYYFNTTLNAVGNKDGSVGQRPAKGSMPVEAFWKIKMAPAIYEAEFDMKIGSDGKPVLSIVDLDYIEEVALKPVSQKQPEKAAG